MAYALRSTLFSLKGLREFSRQAHWSKRRKFAAEDLRVDLSNQRCVVTGANQGIGFATAQALALRGAHVLMISRSLERGEAARQQIASSANSHSISLKVCDMGSLSDVRRLAKELLADGPLHALVNNAGCLLHECILTEEGIEKNFATNTCGPFLLTELLLQHTRRIIFVSSGGAYTETLSDAVKDMMFISGTFNGTAQYARNKRQQIALCEHWAQQNIQSLDVCASMHPGWVDTEAVQQALPSFRKQLLSRLRTPEEGADTVVWLCCASAKKIRNGGFYLDREPQKKNLSFGGKHEEKDMRELVSELRRITEVGKRKVST